MKFGRVVAAVSFLAILAVGGSRPAAADESGVSFWIPGWYSSFAAVPLSPGFTLPFVYVHSNGDIGFDNTLVVNGNITGGIERISDLVLIVPSYTFSGLLLGGQPTVGLGWGAALVDVTANATLTGPGGGVVTRNANDALMGGTDLYPQASLRWNRGVHNYLFYVMGGIPVGIYSEDRLANVSINHGALDGGLGYTYYNADNGRQLSATGGVTYNAENADTEYQNGVDGHVDWSVSQDVSETAHLGAVGYFYGQFTGDSGAGAVLGDFKSQVVGVGAEVGNTFGVGPSGEGKGQLQLKTYWEFNGQNRPDGWNFWLTLKYPLPMK